MKKRILSTLLAIVMVAGLLPGFTLTASATSTTSSPVLKNSIVSQETPDDITITYEFKSSSWYPTTGTTYKLYADVNKTTEAGSVVLTDGTAPTIEVTLNEAPVRDTRYYLTATAPECDESNFTSVVVKAYRITEGFTFSYGEYIDIEYVDFFQDQTTYNIVLPPSTASNAAISVAFETVNGSTVTYGGDTALSNGSGSVTASVVSENPALGYNYTINFTTMNLGGQGTETDPYLITNGTELKQLADCLNNCGAAPMDAEDYGAGNFYGYYFKLTNNINLSGIDWEPIGHSGDTYFAGHFDGDGHTVSNMTTTGRTAPGDYGTDCSRYNAAGLFGWCAFGSVKNITVDEANVTAIGQNQMGYAGGLMAVPYECEVVNCHVKNSTIESGRVPTTNSNFAGGVAGMAACATFEKCSSVNNTVRGTQYVGGFIGSQEGASYYTDCYVANTTAESVMKKSSFNCNTGCFASASQDGDYIMTNCFVYNCTTRVAEGANAEQYEEGLFSKYEWEADAVETTNCYYYTTQTYEDATAATAVAKTVQEFADGTVLADLNGDRTGEDAVWMQGDDYPIFKVPMFIVTVNVDSADGGIASGGGTYEKGTSVTVTATPNEGYYFTNWTNESVTELSSTPSYTFDVTSTCTLTANFAVKTQETTPTAVFTAPNQITGLVSGDKYSIYADGEVSVEYTADAGGAITVVDDWFGKTVRIVKRASDDTRLDSDAQELAIPNMFKVTYTDGVDNAEIFADQRYTVEEGTVTPAFNGTPTRSGYTFTGWTPAVSETVTTDVTYTATWSYNIPYIPADPTYPPVVDEGDNGDVSVSPKNPEKGDTVIITPDPDAGYEVDDVIVTDKNGNPVEVIDNGDGTYSFVQPSGKVNIEVTFKKIEKVCPRDWTCPMYGYTDLDRSLWYHDGIHYCIEHSLMQGIGNTQFAPGATTTRAMIVTILWRLEGSPVVNYAMDFKDVAADQWYTEAIRWAASEKIVEGYGNSKFGTGDAITREQMVTIMWRYAKYKGYDVSVGENTNILSYDDAFDVAEYAIPAMQWACGSGMIQGIADGSAMNLAPQGNATRAQAAAILQRYVENVANKN